MLLTCREVLEFATIEGARVCGVEDRTGSLTPGKQADVVVHPLRPHEHLPDHRPGLDRRPAGRHAQRRHGVRRRQALKRDGALVDADLRAGPLPLAASSLDYLLGHTDGPAALGAEPDARAGYVTAACSASQARSSAPSSASAGCAPDTP